MIDFLKVLLIFFPGCSDRASLASLDKNLWEVDLPQVYVIKCFSWMYLPRNGSLSRNAPLEYISRRKSASRSEIIVWQAQKRGVCLFGGRSRWAKSPSPFRLPWLSPVAGLCGPPVTCPAELVPVTSRSTCRKFQNGGNWSQWNQ